MDALLRIGTQFSGAKSNLFPQPPSSSPSDNEEDGGDKTVAEPIEERDSEKEEPSTTKLKKKRQRTEKDDLQLSAKKRGRGKEKEQESGRGRGRRSSSTGKGRLQRYYQEEAEKSGSERSERSSRGDGGDFSEKERDAVEKSAKAAELRETAVELLDGQSVYLEGVGEVEIIEGEIELFVSEHLEEGPGLNLCPFYGVDLADAVHRGCCRALHSLGGLWTKGDKRDVCWATGGKALPLNCVGRNAKIRVIASDRSASFCLRKHAEAGRDLCVFPSFDRIVSVAAAAPITAFVGAKGSGKSTLLWYALNRLLRLQSNGRGVVLLDLDPGQPEFGVPGCFAVHLVRKPIAKPPVLRTFGETEKSRVFFVGSVNIGRSPTSFTSTSKAAIEIAKEWSNEQSCPLLVNTNGWVRGLGLELLLSSLSAARPDGVVVLEDGRGERTSRGNAVARAPLSDAIESMRKGKLLPENCKVVALDPFSEAKAMEAFRSQTAGRENKISNAEEGEDDVVVVGRRSAPLTTAASALRIGRVFAGLGGLPYGSLADFLVPRDGSQSRNAAKEDAEKRGERAATTNDSSIDGVRRRLLSEGIVSAASFLLRRRPSLFRLASSNGSAPPLLPGTLCLLSSPEDQSCDSKEQAEVLVLVRATVSGAIQGFALWGSHDSGDGKYASVCWTVAKVSDFEAVPLSLAIPGRYGEAAFVCTGTVSASSGSTQIKSKGSAPMRLGA